MRRLARATTLLAAVLLSLGACTKLVVPVEEEAPADAVEAAPAGPPLALCGKFFADWRREAFVSRVSGWAGEIAEAQTLKDAQETGCDVFIEEYGGASARATSVYSRKVVIPVYNSGALGFKTALAQAGRHIADLLAPGTPLYARIVADREAYRARTAPPPAAAEAPAAPPPAPALVSDVDRPSYRLAERPDDFAVVVGIGKYSDLPEAQFAERDAEAVKEHLLAEGFPSRNVVFLTGEKAGFKGIEKFVETWLPHNVDADSRVFFYFSGHGAPDPKSGQAYLLPYDGDPSFLENTGYPVQRLYAKLGALKAKEVIVALDSCFSGAGGRSVLAKGARPLVTKVEAAAAPRNMTVFAAAEGDQITSTLEDQGHGAFTYYFLKGLSGAAKGASGRVTARSLYDYLKPKVQDAARRQNRDQEPVLSGSGDRELARF
jgi:hypothetical protein